MLFSLVLCYKFIFIQKWSHKVAFIALFSFFGKVDFQLFYLPFCFTVHWFQRGILIVLDIDYSEGVLNGTDYSDSKALDELSKAFGKEFQFTVEETIHNPTDERLLKLLKDLRTKDYSNVNCIVLLVNSHGRHPDVLTSKDDEVSIF